MQFPHAGQFCSIEFFSQFREEFIRRSRGLIAFPDAHKRLKNFRIIKHLGQDILVHMPQSQDNARVGERPVDMDTGNVIGKRCRIHGG